MPENISPISKISSNLGFDLDQPIIIYNVNITESYYEIYN